MDMQTMRGKEQMKSLPFKERVKNFFFYYKWHVIAVVFLIVVIAFTLVECSRRVQEDMMITYFSEDYISEDSAATMRDFFGYDFCIDDINGDGEKNLMLSAYSGVDQNVMTKYMAEIAAGDSMAFLFDQTYYDITMQNQPESIDFAYDITQNAKLKELFGLGDKPLYFAVKALYDSEKGDEYRENMHGNAINLYNIIVGDDMTAVYFSTSDFDDALIKALKEKFEIYAENINGVDQKVIGISQVKETDSENLEEYAETINNGTASAFLTDAVFYKAFRDMYPSAIADSEDISALFGLPEGSLYYILRAVTGSETNPEKSELLRANAVNILNGLRAE